MALNAALPPAPLPDPRPSSPAPRSLTAPRPWTAGIGCQHPPEIQPSILYAPLQPLLSLSSLPFPLAVAPQTGFIGFAYDHSSKQPLRNASPPVPTRSVRILTPPTSFFDSAHPAPVPTLGSVPLGLPHPLDFFLVSLCSLITGKPLTSFSGKTFLRMECYDIRASQRASLFFSFFPFLNDKEVP